MWFSDATKVPLAEGVLSLNDIGPGSACIIRKLHGYGGIRQRLLDMGFIPNSRVQVIRSAPLKDPIEIQVGDAFVALRRAEARLIEVAHV